MPPETATKPIDVLGLGCVAVDDLLYVSDYPPEDSKARVRCSERHVGGLTATALVAAARLGARCAYAGSLGSDDLSQLVTRQLEQEGVDLQHVLRRDNACPVHSVIVVGESRRTRTIMYEVSDAARAAPGWPPEEVIHAAKVLFVDTFGVEAMLRASRLAATADIPVVADFESIQEDHRFAELVTLADHPVVSLEFARRWTGCSNPGEAAKAMWNDWRRAVVVTCGRDGCWYVGHDSPGQLRHQPAFPVEVVDTTGCGDVFHGAYAAGLAEGLDLSQRVRLASAAAALKAQRRGGQAGIPTRAVVDEFLNK
jgi:sulfofructose kinase